MLQQDRFLSLHILCFGEVFVEQKQFDKKLDCVSSRRQTLTYLIAQKQKWVGPRKTVQAPRILMMHTINIYIQQKLSSGTVHILQSLNSTRLCVNFLQNVRYLRHAWFWFGCSTHSIVSGMVLISCMLLCSFYKYAGCFTSYQATRSSSVRRSMIYGRYD
jgi:hypothetical protein